MKLARLTFPSARSSTWPALSFAVSATLLGAAAWRVWTRLGRPAAGIDDADITLVYARNLAAGHGFVYNVGGERVEGASSPVWTLFAAAVSRLTASPEPILAGASVLALSLALVLLMHAMARASVDGFASASPKGIRAPDGSRTHPPIESIFAAATVLLWTLASPEFVAWTCLSLMETGIWCAALVAAVAILIGWLGGPRADANPPRALALLAVAITLLRPEGALVSLLILGSAAAMKAIRRQTGRDLLFRLGPAAAAVVATAVVSTIVRLLYFGVPLPNTFYAKIGNEFGYELEQGWTYLKDFCRANPAAPIAILAGISMSAFFLGPRRGQAAPTTMLAGPGERTLWISLLLLALLAVPILLGGDHFGGFRFYQPVWPILALPFAFAIQGTRALRFPRPIGILLAAVIAAASVFLAHAGSESTWKRPGRLPIRLEFEIAVKGREVGRALGRLFCSEDLPAVGVITAGGVKLVYPGPVYDLMGMNWTPMAHAGRNRRGERGRAAFDASVFWSAPPDILVASVLYQGARPMTPMQQSFENQVLDGLLFDPEFAQVYRFGRLSRPGGNETEAIVGYVRRDFLAARTGLEFTSWQAAR